MFPGIALNSTLINAQMIINRKFNFVSKMYCIIGEIAECAMNDSIKFIVAPDSTLLGIL